MVLAMYLVILVLSVISSCIGFALEIITGNMRHVNNGREPNAGAALFPVIPMVQITYLSIAWSLNQLHHNMGYIIVAGYSTLSMFFRLIALRKANAKLILLKQSIL